MSKVLIFIDWFAPGYKAGGPITSNVNIVEHLSDKLDFYVITSSFDYHATAPYKNIQEISGLIGKEQRSCISIRLVYRGKS